MKILKRLKNIYVCDRTGLILKIKIANFELHIIVLDEILSPSIVSSMSYSANSKSSLESECPLTCIVIELSRSQTLLLSLLLDTAFSVVVCRSAVDILKSRVYHCCANV